MPVPDEVLELLVIQNQITSHRRLLFEYLKNANYVAFERLARSERFFAKKNENYSENQLDYVYPYPLDKTLLDLACSAGGPEEFVQFTSANEQEAFVKLMLELHANPNKENVAHQRSPLHFAAETGNAGVLKILLSNHAIKPNLEVARQTALHLAISNKHIECVEILLDHNASPNIANSKGLTPTHMAALTAQEAVINLIFSRSKCPPDIDSFKDFTRRTTRQVLEQKLPHLHLPPIRNRDTDISDLKYFLDRHDEDSYLTHVKTVAIETEEITELLKISARHNLLIVVKHLVKQIQKYRTKRAILADAACIAVERGHHRVLQALFDACTDRIGTLLIKACQELGTHAVCGSDRVECVRLILQKSVNVRCVNALGNTALHYAAAAGSTEIITSLLEAGSYIGHRNKEGISPLKNISPKCLSRYLNNCLKTDTDDTENSNHSKIYFDYQCFLPNYQKDGKKDFDRNLIEMQPFVDIAESKAHRHLLNHPILSSILSLKWKRTWPILCYSFLIYSLFHITLIAYMLCRPCTRINVNSHKNDITDHSNPTGTRCWVPVWLSNATLWLLTVIAFILRVVMQIFLSPSYFLSSQNWFELSIIFLGTISLAGARPLIDTVVIILVTWELINLIGQHSVSKYLILAVPVLFAFYMMRDPHETNIYDLRVAHSNRIVTLIKKFYAAEAEVIHTLAHILLIFLIFLMMAVLFKTLVTVTITDTTKVEGLISETKFLANVETIIVGSPFSESQQQSWYRLFLKLVAINPLRLLSKSILVRCELPQADGISIEPLTSNTVIFRRRRGSMSKASNLTLDTHIIKRAQNIIELSHDSKMRKKILDRVSHMSKSHAAKEKSEMKYRVIMDILHELLKEQRVAKKSCERMHNEIKDLLIENLGQKEILHKSIPTAQDIKKSKKARQLVMLSGRNSYPKLDT